MAGWKVPPLLYEDWVWLIICVPLVLAVLAINCFRKGIPPRPKPHPFFVRHKRTLSLVSDLLIVCFVSATVVYVAWSSFRDLFSLSTRDEFLRQMELRFAWSSFYAGMAAVSAWGTCLVGMLSVFQSSITTLKRIVLLVLCLLPAVFVAGMSTTSSEVGWRTIPLGLLFCLPSWLVNGPAVVTGRPFFRVVWRVVCRLRMASGDYPEWW